MSVLPYRSKSDAVSLLQILARHNAPLHMSHAYRGVLFTQELSLVSLSSDHAMFKAARCHLETQAGDRIFLHSPDISEVLSARVIELDIQLGRLVLGDFAPTGRSWADRSHDRVQPRQPIRVNLRCDSCTLPTSLENVSLVGIGLLAYKPTERGLDPRVNVPVKIDFELPVTRGRVSLPGRLANITYPGARLACLGINTFPNTEQARVLERYITQRKAEIVDELDNSFMAAFEPQSVKELYF
jgi:hypothetical protein